MARHATRLFLNLACGASLPWICSAALAEDLTPAKPTPSVVKKAASYDDATSETTPLPSTEAAPEVVRERYTNGRIKVERHVAQDAQGNYFNHGLWTQWDERGHVIGTGEYKNGKREGLWARAYLPTEGTMFKSPLYQGFQGPFASEAEFHEGQLHGKWRVYDSRNHKMSEWTFEHGKRTGKSTWWHPNGQKRREVDYRDDEIDGEVLEWNFDQKLTSHERYYTGRKLAKQVTFHSPGVKKSEGWTLFAREIATSNYDWWNGAATITVTGKEGVDQKQGMQISWHKNGQKRMEGNYEANLQTGKFTWWYANGQKQLEGEYVDGKENGRFIWWHENGLKQLEGLYQAGAQNGKWMRWNTDGKVIEVGDYSDVGRKLEDDPKPSLTEAEEDFTAPTLRSASPAQVAPRLRRQ